MDNEDLNKKVAKRLYDEVWNQQKLEVLEEIFDGRAIFNIGEGKIEGVEIAKEIISDFLRSFPDVLHVIDDVIAEGDKVVVRWHGYGTHQGEFMGIPATEKKMRYTGINIFRIEEGKIKELWLSSDMLGLINCIKS